MNNFINKVAAKWKNYKFRFVPWIMFNMTSKTSRTSSEMAETFQQDVYLDHLTKILSKLSQYSSLKDDVKLYEEVHKINKEILWKSLGFSLTIDDSGVPGAGKGVFVCRGRIVEGSLVCLYPGTVYQPQDPILLQSVANQFILRSYDGVLLDGNNRGLSPLIFRSCTGRDQVGMIKVADTSWLTSYPVNPMSIGQIVNNETPGRPANVRYQELDLPSDFPLLLRKFLPNIHYQGLVQSGLPLRLVMLQAVRDIEEGQELLSSYFTVVR